MDNIILISNCDNKLVKIQKTQILYNKNEVALVRVKNYRDLEKLMAYHIKYGKSLITSVLEIDNVNIYNELVPYIKDRKWIDMFSDSISSKEMKNTYTTFFIKLMEFSHKDDYVDYIINLVPNDNIELFQIIERYIPEQTKHYYQQCVDLCGRYNSINLLRYILTRKKDCNLKFCLKNACEKGNKDIFDTLSIYAINVRVDNYTLFDLVIKSGNIEFLNSMLYKIDITEIQDSIISRWLEIGTNIGMLESILTFVKRRYMLNPNIYIKFAKSKNPSDDDIEYIRLLLNIDNNPMNVLPILKAGYTIELSKDDCIENILKM